MKIKMKLTNHQAKVWIAYLEILWTVPAIDSLPVVKMIYHALSNLIHQLKKATVIEKEVYKIDVETVNGLAFIAHIQSYSGYLANPTDTVIINEIIGIIDQKTK